jgi:hypothetical protein
MSRLPDYVAAARAFRARDWWSIPLIGKDPSWLGKGWPELRLDPDKEPERFRGQTTGIGILLGASGLVDLEADVLAAEYALERLAPSTGCVWEHGGRCHRIYRSDAQHRSWPGPAWAHAGGEPSEKPMLVELRAGNHQSVAPPSIHPEDGLPYRWVAEGEPAAASAECLARAATLAAVAGALASRWSQTVRQQVALALAGFLRRAGITEEEAEAVVEAICRAAADEEQEKRLAAVRDTFSQPDTAQVTGLPTLAKLLGQEFADWLARLFPRASASANPVGEPEVVAAWPWPDPLAEEALYGLAGEIVRTLEPHTEADPAALLIQFLIGFGNAMGRGPYFVAEADRHYTNLFGVLVGLSAKGRKGSSWGLIRCLFRAAAFGWEKACLVSGLSSGEGLIWAVRDPVEKRQPIKQKGRVVDYEMVIDDAGVEDKRLLVVEAEFAATLQVLRREGNTLSPIIRNAWDTGSLRSLTKNSPAVATGAHISVIAHITRDELLRYLDATEAGNGFGNRFLWVCVRRSKVLPEGGSLHEVDLHNLTDRLASAITFAQTVGELRRDEEARAIWHAVYPELSEGKPGLLGAMIARAEAQVMRLACLYALLDQSPVIQGDHLQAALAVWDYVEASARFIFGDTLGDPVADELLRALRRTPDGLTRTETSHLFGRNLDARRIGRALETLLQYDLVRCQREETEGRPVERWYAIRPGDL